MRLKRKLKPQFLNQINKTSNIKETMSIEKKLLRGTFTLLLVLLLLLWGSIPSIVLHVLGIDAEGLSDTVRILISFINDMLFILLFDNNGFRYFIFVSLDLSFSIHIFRGSDKG